MEQVPAPVRRRWLLLGDHVVAGRQVDQRGDRVDRHPSPVSGRLRSVDLAPARRRRYRVGEGADASKGHLADRQTARRGHVDVARHALGVIPSRQMDMGRVTR